jgi:hypothetical protein
MKLDDQTLRKAFAARTEDAERSDTCPPPQRIWDAVAGRLSSSETKALLDHSNRCSACSVAWRMALEMMRQMPAPEPKRTLADWFAAIRWQWQPVAFAAAALVLVAIAVTLSLRLRPSPSLAALHLQLAVLHGTAPLRGDSAHPGDRLALEAEVGTEPYAELRVFREDRQLILQCPPESSSCRREGNRLRAEVVLPAVGRYQSFVVASKQPLPPPAGTLVEDTTQLMRAGARLELGEPIRVW